MTGPEAQAAGEEAEAAGDFVGASAAYQAVLSDVGSRASLGRAQFSLGRVAWRQGQLDSAKERFEAARATALHAEDDEARARAENGIGLVHYGRGEYVQARAAFDVARDYVDAIRFRAKRFSNLGILANIDGDFDGSEDAATHGVAPSFQQAGEIAPAKPSPCTTSAWCNADLHNWDDADDAFRDCLDLCEQQGNRPFIASVLVNRSEVYCARERFDEAIADCDIAISIAKEIGAEVQRGEALRWKGHALSCLRADTRRAESPLRDAIRIARRTHVKAARSRDHLETSGVNAASRRR